jgi:hypothetical protein
LGLKSPRDHRFAHLLCQLGLAWPALLNVLRTLL